ncbi:MAG: Spy/CpxP family protein refolding chaperone [Deltaproteobacteria bacterium]|nr:Spy/CpxP family protein refolding chaperone [Deltaproteobacteria bacterium]
MSLSRWVVTVLLAVSFAVTSIVVAEGCDMMGGGMKGGKMGEGSSPWFHHGVTLTLQNADRLGIDEKQKGQLEEIRTRYTKDIIRQEAELRIAETELDTLLREKEMDLPKVKEAVRKVAGVEAQIRYLRVEAFTEARKVLTDEQRKKLKELMETPSTPMKMEMMECPMMKGGMGEGMGKMGGMDCPMMKGMQGMMGGGMIKGGKSNEVAKAEETMTQEKTAGAVTVNATFKNPGAIGGKEELVFNLKLDTHTVNLDTFNFSEGVVLRDETGKVYKPVSAESTGAGHHRSAVVRFTNLGKVKSLELVVKDLAGVKETVFKWEL